jgi:GT2 family glycosyltransferase
MEQIRPEQVRHVPHVLYHARVEAEGGAPFSWAGACATQAGEKALNDHYRRMGVQAAATVDGHGYRTRYAMPDPAPMVTLIIPTRNGLELLRQCIGSILEKTAYPNYEILVIDNGSDDPAALAYLQALQSDARVRVVRDDRPFNFSALNNAAVELARGELIGLVNNDIEVISPDWLAEMAGHALRSGVGAVGARLLFPDDTLQHAGLILDLVNVALQFHRNLPRQEAGCYGRASLTQNFSAVTAACMVLRKKVYQEVGGFNETHLQVAYNDVDLCLRLRRAGYRNVWTPYAELYHHESATRGYETTPEKRSRFADEMMYMKLRWRDWLMSDPAYSPNLVFGAEHCNLAWPPRAELLA